MPRVAGASPSWEEQRASLGVGRRTTVGATRKYRQANMYTHPNTNQTENQQAGVARYSSWGVGGGRIRHGVSPRYVPCNTARHFSSALFLLRFVLPLPLSRPLSFFPLYALSRLIARCRLAPSSSLCHEVIKTLSPACHETLHTPSPPPSNMLWGFRSSAALHS